LNRYPRYDLIREKLEQYAVPDTEALWQGMNTVLDAAMPEKQERRPYAALFTMSGFFMIITISFLSVLAICLATSPGSLADARRRDIDFKAIPVVIHRDDKKSTEEEANTLNTGVATETTQTSKVSTPAPYANDDVQQDETSALKHQGSGTPIMKEAKDLNVAAVVNAEPSNASKKILNNKFVKNNVRDVSEKKSDRGNLRNSVVATNTNHFFKKDAVLFAPQKAQNEVKAPTIAAGDAGSNEIAFTTTDLRTHYIAPSPYLTTVIFQSQVNAGHSDIVAAQIAMKKSERSRGFTAGISANLNLPVSRQEMSTVNVNGKQSKLIDYLPSVFVQYHFSKKLFVETEFQFISPQYTPELKLANKFSDPTAVSYKEHEVELNKLYYLNVPVSINYSPLPNLYIGAGLQYSYLRKTILEEVECMWAKDASGWKMTSETKTIKVKSNPNAEAKSNNGRGRGSTPGTPVPVMTQLDTVAQKFRSSDWRFLADAHYNWKRFNLGVRFNRGLNNYITSEVSTYNSTIKVQDRNESFQLYLRYTIADLRRKR
jgi:hypothetical protein